jgi:putative acetyltransferase
MGHIKRTDSDNPDFIALVKQLDAYLKVLDGDDHVFYAQFNKVHNLKHVVLYYEDDIAIGCGAFKNLDEKTVEIKRMYVKEAYRGRGIAAAVLKELETWATEMFCSTSVLETGHMQSDAIRLYQKSGYSVIPNYGQYIGVENSRCFKKNL